MWTTMDAPFLFVYLPIHVSGVNQVAPPTTLGTEEWRAPCPLGSCQEGAGQLHEVKVGVICER